MERERFGEFVEIAQRCGFKFGKAKGNLESLSRGAIHLSILGLYFVLRRLERPTWPRESEGLSNPLLLLPYTLLPGPRPPFPLSVATNEQIVLSVLNELTHHSVALHRYRR